MLFNAELPSPSQRPPSSASNNLNLTPTPEQDPQKHIQVGFPRFQEADGGFETNRSDLEDPAAGGNNQPVQAEPQNSYNDMRQHYLALMDHDRDLITNTDIWDSMVTPRIAAPQHNWNTVDGVKSWQKDQEAKGKQPAPAHRDPHTNQEKIYTHQAESCLHQEDPYTHQQEPHTPKEKPYTHEEEAHTRQEDPYAHQEMPYRHPGDPYTSQVHQEKTYSHQEDPYQQEPYTLQKHPYTHQQEQYTHQEGPHTHQEEPFTHHAQRVLYAHHNPYAQQEPFGLDSNNAPQRSHSSPWNWDFTPGEQTDTKRHQFGKKDSSQSFGNVPQRSYSTPWNWEGEEADTQRHQFGKQDSNQSFSSYCAQQRSFSSSLSFATTATERTPDVLRSSAKKKDYTDAQFDAKTASHTTKRVKVRQFNLNISACVKNKNWRKALKLLNTMSNIELKPNVVTMNAVISACGAAKQWEQALREFRRMAELNIEPNFISYSAMMTACCSSSQWHVALRTFDEMLASSVEPNEVTFTSAIMACGRIGQHKLALLCLHNMQNKGLKPNVITYSAAIQSCKGDPRVVVDLLNDMLANSIIPNIITINAALNCCTAKHQATAQLILNHMTRARLTPDGVTIVALRNIFGDVRRTLALHQENCFFSTGYRASLAEIVNSHVAE